MVRQLANPQIIAGLILMAFSGFLLLEAVGCFIVVESVLAALIGAAGWFLRRNAVTTQKSLTASWRRCLLVGIPGLVVCYVLSYMLLMDRSRPTRPTSEFYRHF